MKSWAKGTTSLLRLQIRRKLWLQVHFYLGLVAGAILAVVGLTGSILVFYEELQEILNAEQIVIEAPPEDRRKIHNLDEIIAAAEAVKPKGSKFFALYYPRNAECAYKFLYFVRDPKVLDNGIGLFVWLGLPYSFHYRFNPLAAQTESQGKKGMFILASWYIIKN